MFTKDNIKQAEQACELIMCFFSRNETIHHLNYEQYYGKIHGFFFINSLRPQTIQFDGCFGQISEVGK